MSSRSEVFIRILVLLQRKMLIETKNRRLKCLKQHYSTVRSMKNVAVLMKDGAFALFCHPHPGGFDSSRIPTPGNLPSKAKKMLMPGGGRGGTGRSWNWLMHNKVKVIVLIFEHRKRGFYRLLRKLDYVFHLIPRNPLRKQIAFD